MTASSVDILWLKDVTKDDAYSAGETGVMLGKMLHAGLVIPEGFIVTPHAYTHFLQETPLLTKLTRISAEMDYRHIETVSQTSLQYKKLIMDTKFPDALMTQLVKAYELLNGSMKNHSITVQWNSPHLEKVILNGETNFLLSVKRAWASLFEPHMLMENHEKNHDHLQKTLAIVVQKVLPTEKTGKLFTADPLTGDTKKMIVEIANDEHYVLSLTEKPTIVEKKPGSDPLLTEKEVLELTKLGEKLTTAFYFPQEATWTMDKEKIFFLQTKPLHLPKPSKISTYFATKLPLLTSGTPLSRGIASGPVRFIKAEKDLEKVLLGDVLVISSANLTYKQTLKKASAIITTSGGRTSHAALFARELGIPAVLITTSLPLKLRQMVTVDGKLGELYNGTPYNLDYVAHTTATQVYTSLTTSALAEKISGEHINGVLLELSNRVDPLNEKNPQKLAQEISFVCHSFQAQPIIYQIANFFRNESESLLGYHGTYRMLHEPAPLEHELEAVAYARTHFDCKNLGIMLPFVRSTKEFTAAKHIMNAFGLSRSATFKLWLSVSTPANVINLNEFIATGVDGIALNINDLASLLIGTDRDDPRIAGTYDLFDQSVMWALEKTISTASKHHIPSLIYGSELANHASLVEKIVTMGVNALVVAPQAIDATRERISQSERHLLTTS